MVIIWSSILTIALLLAGIILLIFFRDKKIIKVFGVLLILGSFIIISPAIIWWLYGC